MNDLVLYYSPYCPYCVKVLRFMKKADITLELRDTNDTANLKNLIEVGKMNQVPCLFVDGKAMYESDDIIEYLKNRFGVF